jgi:hypothetical protein
MCDLFDWSWKYLLVFAALLSLAFIPVRLKIAHLVSGPARSSREAAQLLARLQIFTFWARGLVAFIMMALFVMGLACIGSPGDIGGVIPE